MLIIAVLAATGAVVAASQLRSDDDRGARPPAVCNVAPSDGDEAINAAIESCPDGSTIRFPAGAVYHQDDSIVVRQRRDLVIDGNGSTFLSSAPNGRTVQIPNWRLLKARNVTVKNMKVVGNFFPTGPRSLETVNSDFETCEFNAGFAVSGGDGVVLEDLKAHNVCGDGFGTYRSEFFDHASANEMPTNVRMTRVEARTTARMCFGPTQVDGLWIEDSVCQDAWYGGLDAESDGRLDPVRNLHILRNTFDGFNNFGILIPVAGEPGTTRDIHIRYNRLLTAPDQQCNQAIHIGSYADSNPRSFENVFIENNEIASLTRGIVADHVIGGAIRDNRIRQVAPPEGFTVSGYCGEDRQIIVTNSHGVVIENGAGSTPPTAARPTT